MKKNVLLASLFSLTLVYSNSLLAEECEGPTCELKCYYSSPRNGNIRLDESIPDEESLEAWNDVVSGDEKGHMISDRYAKLKWGFDGDVNLEIIRKGNLIDNDGQPYHQLAQQIRQKYSKYIQDKETTDDGTALQSLALRYPHIDKHSIIGCTDGDSTVYTMDLYFGVFFGKKGEDWASAHENFRAQIEVLVTKDPDTNTPKIWDVDITSWDDHDGAMARRYILHKSTFGGLKWGIISTEGDGGSKVMSDIVDEFLQGALTLTLKDPQNRKELWGKIKPRVQKTKVKLTPTPNGSGFPMPLGDSFSPRI